MVVGEDDAAVILAGLEVETVVDYVLRVDEARVNDPFGSFDCFVEVVTFRWSCGKTIGELGCCCEV